MDTEDRISLVSQMAARIYCERLVTQEAEQAMRMAVGDALLILDRVEKKFTPEEVGQ